jgi:hypothetical protein
LSLCLKHCTFAIQIQIENAEKQAPAHMVEDAESQW